MSSLLLKNCRLYDAGPDARTVSVSARDGRIRAVGPDLAPDRAAIVIDVGGRLVAPGFIDVHIQGAGGADVLDATPQAPQTISQTCARFGVTSFLATTVYLAHGSNQHLSVAAECTGSDLGGANLLGIHIEGPFISPRRRGMIQPDCIAEPSERILSQIDDLCRGTLRMMTIAPEIQGSTDLVERLVRNKTIASFGHSDATYQETLAGFDAGITHVTHTFNAMPAMHHRAPGPLPAILERQSVTAQLICDGVHIHPPMLRLLWNALGPDRCVPITDGMQAMGLPDGHYKYKGIDYESKDGTAWYKDGTLIGTALGLNQMLRRLRQFTGCRPADAIKAATETPARALGLDKHKGKIAPGMDADIVVLEADWSICMTIVAGRLVYQAATDSPK